MTTWTKAGRVVKKGQMMKMAPPIPRPQSALGKMMSTEDARTAAKALIGTQQLKEWLDHCIANTEHNLNETEWTWDGIPESHRYNMEWNLAMRYLELQAAGKV